LCALNVSFVYLHKFRSFQINKKEQLKVKWLANLILAFFSPILVFVSNEQADYKILRFNQDIHTISLLIIACTGYWYISCILYSEKQSNDINVQALKKEKRALTIVGGAILVGIVGQIWGAPQPWIYN
jgi:hypothetical protein